MQAHNTELNRQAQLSVMRINEFSALFNRHHSIFFLTSRSPPSSGQSACKAQRVGVAFAEVHRSNHPGQKRHRRLPETLSSRWLSDWGAPHTCHQLLDGLAFLERLKNHLGPEAVGKVSSFLFHSKQINMLSFCCPIFRDHYKRVCPGNPGRLFFLFGDIGFII